MKKISLIILALLATSCAPEKNISKNYDKELQKQIEKSLQQEDFAEAIKIYEDLAAKNPDNREYQLVYANSLRMSGYVEKAKAVYSKLLERNIKDVDAIEGKALCFLSEGNFNEARKLFSDVLRLDATRWRAMNGLAVAFSLDKEIGVAMEYYNSALEISPNNPSILNNIGLSYAFNGDYQKAIMNLQKASSFVETGSNKKKKIDMNLSLVYGVKGDMQKAEDILKGYMEAKAVYETLSLYAKLKNDNKLAKSYLNKALR